MSERTISLVTWQDMEIEVSHEPGRYSLHDDKLDYVELRVLCPEFHPLPLTDTPHTSVYEVSSIITEYGGVEDYVEALLDSVVAESPDKWEAAKLAFGQMELEL